MVDRDNDNRPDETEGAPPRHIHIEGEEHKKKASWLPWLLALLGLLALLFLLSRCNRDEAAVVTDNTTVVNETTTVTNTADTGTVIGNTSTVASTTAAAAGVSQLGSYLQGSEPAPRTFNFEKLNFDTGQSDIRDADRDEINQIAGVLRQYGNTNVRVVGYADARGASEANQRLGQARADAVKAALVAAGIPAARIEAGSGGESDPVDSNATAGGQAENRRTELVVTQR